MKTERAPSKYWACSCDPKRGSEESDSKPATDPDEAISQFP